MTHRSAVRPVLRRALPFAARWRVRAARRRIADALSAVRFVSRNGDAGEFTHLVCAYRRALVCYTGQESRFDAKKHNIELALSRIDGAVVAPGDTFSFWKCVGRPTRRAGYASAAALKDGVLVEDVGGAICLASTLLYNVGLLSGMVVDERWSHSVDSYGEARYFELGRDAAVEYAYRDLRLRNDWDAPLLVRAAVTDGEVRAEAWSPRSLDIEVQIAVDPPEHGDHLMSVCTIRRVTRGGVARTDDLGESTYRIAAGGQELRTTN